MKNLYRTLLSIFFLVTPITTAYVSSSQPEKVTETSAAVKTDHDD